MKKGVFFDLDGTLVDTLPDICGALNAVRLAFGLQPLPHPQITAAIGKGAESLVQKTLPEIPLDQHPQAVDKYRQFSMDTFCTGGAVYKGVPETLSLLKKQGMVLGVATNKPHLLALKTLKHYLPQISFEVVLGPERVSQKKPSPHHLWEALKQAGVQPENAWFVGDDPVDLACAEAAKVRFLGAGWGFGGVAPDGGRLLRQFPDILGKIGSE